MIKFNFSAFDASISGALENVFNTYVKPEVMGVTNLDLYVISAGLLIALIVRGLFIWNDYRNDRELRWGSLLTILICLVISISAKLWMWSIIGW